MVDRYLGDASGERPPESEKLADPVQGICLRSSRELVRSATVQSAFLPSGPRETPCRLRTPELSLLLQIGSRSTSLVPYPEDGRKANNCISHWPVTAHKKIQAPRSRLDNRNRNPGDTRTPHHRCEALPAQPQRQLHFPRPSDS